MPSSHEWTRVVVLRPASHGPIDQHLKTALTQREWFAVEHTEPHQALAELCLREKAQAARAGWGLQRVEKSALLIVDPFEFPAARTLIAATRKYVPTASIWTYAEGEFTAVGKAREAAVPSTIQPPGASTVRRASAAPSRPGPPLSLAPVREEVSPVFAERLAGATSPVSEADEEPPAPTVRISREEIDLLLRADDEELSQAEAALKLRGRHAERNTQ